MQKENSTADMVVPLHVAELGSVVLAPHTEVSKYHQEWSQNTELGVISE